MAERLASPAMREKRRSTQSESGVPRAFIFNNIFELPENPNVSFPLQRGVATLGRINIPAIGLVLPAYHKKAK
jgi:hypothetical protein